METNKYERISDSTYVFNDEGFLFKRLETTELQEAPKYLQMQNNMIIWKRRTSLLLLPLAILSIPFVIVLCVALSIGLDEQVTKVARDALQFLILPLGLIFFLLAFSVSYYVKLLFGIEKMPPREKYEKGKTEVSYAPLIRDPSGNFTTIKNSRGHALEHGSVGAFGTIVKLEDLDSTEILRTCTMDRRDNPINFDLDD